MGVNVELSIGCAKRTPQANQSISNKQCNEFSVLYVVFVKPFGSFVNCIKFVVLGENRRAFVIYSTVK